MTMEESIPKEDGYGFSISFPIAISFMCISLLMPKKLKSPSITKCGFHLISFLLSTLLFI